MGGSFSFHPGSDSIVEPGQKSVLSDAIDGVTPEKLFDGIERYLKAGKTKGGREAEFDLQDKESAVEIKQVFVIPELFGGGTHTIYNRYSFDAAKRCVTHEFFSGPAFWDKQTPNSTARLYVHDPCKVEYWQDAHEVRTSGPMQKGMLEKVLSEMGSKAKAVVDQPSIQDSGATSVVSEPIEDAEVTPDAYLEFFKTFLVEGLGSTELPDGTVIEERAALLDVFGLGAKSFAKHEFNKDENHLYCYEYGEDESLSEIGGITHVQVHKEPFRLEQWNVQHPGRRAGPSQVSQVKPFIEAVLKFLEEGS